MEIITTLALGNLVSTAISDWIGPVLVGIIATVAVVLLWKRQFAGFLTFAAMAVLAALFVFFGGNLFGKNGNITKAGNDVAKKINAVDLTATTYAEDFLIR
ncbi:hypothetical protein [Microbacterium sp. SORGH_AS_0421]|uniref:hypothetical protein n=1 Tax=Microbacterium sp. SORGH_AS_0421 TaxID=3041768 RepID=UPI00278E9632|nr:hypothetical protein [Microbacterium sp. SORGH_AS_0421]MDQ1175402.1 CBS domain containing-hemolysin-like protein [Microbacterium sp. SORGH_AS_0421]